MEWLYQYSIGEFLDAINSRGKFFRAIGPLVKLESDLLKEMFKRSLGPMILVAPSVKGIYDQIDSFGLLAPYDEFDPQDVVKVIDQARELVVTDHDRMDLFAATRIPSLLWNILNGVSSDSGDKKILQSIQQVINGLDLLHGKNLLLNSQISEAQAKSQASSPPSQKS
jgi:hypothetical protein